MLKFLLFQSVTIFSLMAQVPKYVKMSTNLIEIEKQNYFAITLDNTEGWHTYWKNPGDAGLPIKIKFYQAGSELKLEELRWPAPKRYIEDGDILAYGYSGSKTFFFKTSPKLKKEKIIIKGQWLVCKNICIPGEDENTLDLSKNLPLKTSNSTISTSEIKKRFKNLPIKDKEPKLSFSLVKGEKANTLSLNYSMSNTTPNELKKDSNLITPYLLSPLDFKREELVYDKETNSLFGRMIIAWDGEYEEPSYPLPKDGLFKDKLSLKFLISTKKSLKVITQDFESFSLSGFSQHDSFMKKRELKANSSPVSNSLLYFILFAFLGGLILNLMPCVLPVISLKLFGLIAHSKENKKQILKHNLFYSFGVWSSFMVLALVVFFLKISGEEIGWGFQMQSPLFVFSMMIVLLIMAVNMLGLFEFKTPFGNKLGGTKIEEGFIGDFFNGVLATILSTPCSAPFLGVALTFAFTTSSINIFIIFTAVALGLAFPFIITGFFPKMISFLPKPGAWMEKLKYFLGLSLLLTFAWLYDVLASLIDFSATGIYLHFIFTLVFFALFFRFKISKNLVLNIFTFSLPIFLFINVEQEKGFDVYDQLQRSKFIDTNWVKWSTEEMNKAKAQNRWVFIDFTANWCLTCKVNKKLVLKTDDFKKIVLDYDIKLLVGDWTKRDEKITQFLRSYNIVGVPAYFIQDPDGNIVHLGETISISKIEKNLK